MVRKFKSLAFAGALVMVASPVFAQDMATPFGPIDMDPFHILAPAPAPAAAPMVHHHMHHHMHMHMHIHHHMHVHHHMMKKKKM